jgi:hypothetical protein
MTPEHMATLASPAQPARWAGLPCPPAPPPPSAVKLRTIAAELVAAWPMVSTVELAIELAFRTGALSAPALDAMRAARAEAAPRCKEAPR